MALHDVLVCLDGTGTGRLELVTKLARQENAYVTAVYTMPVPQGTASWPSGAGVPPTILGPVSPAGAAAISGEPLAATEPATQVVREAVRADEVEQLFRAELSSRGLKGEWHIFDRTDLAELVQLSQASDLAILGQYDNDSDGIIWLQPDDLLINSGRPVLIVPYAGTFDRIGTRVLVAWDGTREANRALHDVLPMIGGAAAVTVMHFGTAQADLDADRPQLERIIGHLARHGIKARPENTPRGDIPISDLLLSRAADLGADMIVAGAYHHSPLRESLLGGVSRELVAHMTVPVLMSH